MPTGLKKIAWVRICSSRLKGMARIPFSTLAPSTLIQPKWSHCCCSSALTLNTNTTSWFSRWTIASRSRLWFQSLLYYLKSCKPGNAATSASANTRRTINTAHTTARCVRKPSLAPVPNIGGGADKKDLVIRGLQISLAASNIAVKPSSVNALTATTKIAA